MTPFKRVIAAALAAVVIALPTACAKRDVVLVVNGEGISRAVFDRSVEIIKLEDPNAFATPEGAAASNKMIVDGLIDATLMRQEAARIGADLSNEAIEGRLEMFKMGFGDEAAFTAQLEAAGLRIDDLRQVIRDTLAQEAVFTALSEETTQGDAFSSEEVEAYYSENETLFGQPATSQLQHILFDAADKASAESVLADLRAGADFAEAAKQYSKDEASAANGGDLGVSQTSRYVPEFKAAADALAIGEISGLVETQFGWHIIKKLAEEPAVVSPLAEVEDQVRSALAKSVADEAFQALLERLRAEAEIEYVDESLKPAAGS